MWLLRSSEWLQSCFRWGRWLPGNDYAIAKCSDWLTRCGWLLRHLPVYALGGCQGVAMWLLICCR